MKAKKIARVMTLTLLYMPDNIRYSRIHIEMYATLQGYILTYIQFSSSGLCAQACICAFVRTRVRVHVRAYAKMSDSMFMYVDMCL